MKHFLLIVVLMGGSTHIHAALVDNLVVNGSFEDANVKTNKWRVFKSITGWTTQGRGVEIRDNVVGTAHDGEHFAELDSHANSSIFQTLATQANSAYTLSFYYSPRIKQAIDTNGINVFWNGEKLNSEVISAQGGRLNNWLLYSYTVIGTGSDILSFSAVGKNDSLGGNLDAISVSALRAEIGSVPIPAAMFLFTPVLLAFMRLGRNKIDV